MRLGGEYRRAGRRHEAIRTFCDYLAIEPKGKHAIDAAAHVLVLRVELGVPTAGRDQDVCARLPVRIDFLTPRRPHRAHSTRPQVAAI